MKPRNIAIACGVAGIAVGLAAATGIVYRKQIKSAASLKRLTGYADGYDLYAIDIAYDYDLDRIIAAGVRDGKMCHMPLEDVAGKLKFVDPQSDLVREAKALGISFGDE